MGRTFVCGEGGHARCDVGTGLATADGESKGLNVEFLGRACKEAIGTCGVLLQGGGSGDEVLLLTGV